MNHQTRGSRPTLSQWTMQPGIFGRAQTRCTIQMSSATDTHRSPPPSTLEISLATKASTLLKDVLRLAIMPRTTRLHGFGPQPTPRVPVSIFHKKTANEPAPFLLYGYGSYGSSYDVYYNSRWLSLLDRGFAVGIAHIRGGGEFGRGWKLNGKFEHKMNSFTDFIACGAMIQEKWTTPKSSRLKDGVQGLDGRCDEYAPIYSVQ